MKMLHQAIGACPSLETELLTAKKGFHVIAFSVFDEYESTALVSHVDITGSVECLELEVLI